MIARAPTYAQSILSWEQGWSRYYERLRIPLELRQSIEHSVRVAQVLTYYDDPTMVGARLYPQVYQSWEGGASTLKFPDQNTVAVTLRGTDRWLDAYFEIPDANFSGVNQGPQSLVRYQTVPATNGVAASGFVHVSRVRYAVIRGCSPNAGVNVLQTNKPIAEYGNTVNGFQDNFSAATRNTNWVAIGPAGDNYLQQSGLLRVFASQGDPNHLIYRVAGYTNDVYGYLASERILREGGYECRGLYIGVGLFDSGVDRAVMNAIESMARKAGRIAR